MNRPVAAAAAFLALLCACSRADYVPDGPLAKPLGQFDRIDVRTLSNKAAPTSGEATAVSPDAFIQLFRKDLTNRLHRRKVLNLASGPMLILDGSVLKYQCESRKPAYARDNLTNKAMVEVEIVLTDQSGARIGGGKASIEYLGSTQDGAFSGAETRIIRAIAAYLRKAVRGAEPDEPDDSP